MESRQPARPNGCSSDRRGRAATLVEEAEAAVELTVDQPRRAAAAARAVAKEAVEVGDPEATVVAERAMGLAAKELGDLAASKEHAQRAILLASRLRLPRREGEARMSLSLVLALEGRTREALREANQAATLLDGLDAARLQVQRSLILQRLGRSTEALEGYHSALAAFRRLGCRADMARVWSNRAILRAYGGEFEAAEADLRRAEQAFGELGLEMAAATVRHNLGFVAARKGDVPAALSSYDMAATRLERIGVARPAFVLDRCEVLLAVRLVPEARQLARAAVERLEATGMRVDLAEARVMLAQAELLAGDLDAARRTADLARRGFLRQQRPGWAALARYVALRARWQAGRLGPAAAVEARRTAADLDATGWVIAASDARLVAARLSLDAGRLEQAERDLSGASPARRRGPAELRSRAWHAEALLRLARGNRRGALRAIDAGLRVVALHQQTLGATELRAHASGHAAELARLGLSLAVTGGRPGCVLAWSERGRARLHAAPPARPPTDRALAADLASLRAVAAEVEAAALAGQSTSSLLQRQARLEGAVRRRARHVPGSTARAVTPPPSLTELAGHLADRALVEYVEDEGVLHAVTVVDGRARLTRLAPVAEASAELNQLRFCLGRLARSAGSPASMAAARAGADHAALRLEELLLRQLLADVGSRPVVVVPTGALHSLPWALLPSLLGRPVAVAPSATQWFAARAGAGRAGAGGKTLLVAGPGVPTAVEEVASLAPLHPDVNVLTGEDATVARVAEAFPGAELAHVAAHGSFRGDNPLFSSLELADGPLTVYDLDRLPRMPRRIVLSACDSGVSAVSPGNELLGLASALLAFGAQTVVASVVTVPDDATRQLMVLFHQGLRQGKPVSAALASAQETVTRGEPGGDTRTASTLLPTAGFLCLGEG